MKTQLQTIRQGLDQLRDADINESILRNAEYYSYYRREDFWQNDLENKEIEGFNTKTPAFTGFPEGYGI